MEPFPESVRELIQLMAPVNLNCFARCVQSNYAVLTIAQVCFQIRSQLSGYLIVDEVIELSEKFRAGHFTPPLFCFRK